MLYFWICLTPDGSGDTTFLLLGIKIRLYIHIYKYIQACISSTSGPIDTVLFATSSCGPRQQIPLIIIGLKVFFT